MLERLGLGAAADAVTFEDTLAGVAAGLAAGLRVVGVTRTGRGARLAGTAACFEQLDVEAVASLFAR
jgi:beta-phosphoglucomutase-like phosphatase (HAD superfamily)